MNSIDVNLITHNNSEWFYKVISPGKVKITLSSKTGNVEKAVLFYTDDEGDKVQKMKLTGEEDGYEYFEAVTDVNTKKSYFKYSFMLKKGDNGIRLPRKEDSFFEGFTGHITDVPDWARDVVWYQIFPERFRNGDPSNDPKVKDIENPGVKNWKIKEWGSDWYAEDDWEKENYDSVFQSIFDRRYGGDLQGIIDKLDYLEDLGVTAIYLNPVFRGRSLHKYDGNTFHHVDENFGPDPEGDRKMIAEANETDDPKTWVWTKADRLLLKLIDEAHKRNMKIIIDGVFNHSGRDFFAFRDLIKNGRKSRYVDWYEIEEWDDSLPDGFKYRGWWGVHTLPEFKRDKYNTNAGHRRYIRNITRRWMAPDGDVSKGIDGWRLDVAFCLPHGFWKEWRRVVKEINPKAYLTAEVVTIDKSFLQGDEFDAMMNYPFAFAVARFFIDKKDRVTASEFNKMLENLRGEYPKPMTRVMQNLMSSHDSSRLRTLILNPDMNYADWGGHFERSKIEKNPDYRIDRGGEEHRRTHKQIATFQMTYPGAPMIYYGDEIGMSGANDPDCRKPMIWDDIEYADEKVHPHKDRSRPVEKNEADSDLRDHYKKVIAIRNAHPALRRGNFTTLLTDDEKDVFAFERLYKKGDERERIVVVFNNSSQNQEVSLRLDGSYRDLLNEGIELKAADGKLKVKIEPKWAVILLEE